MALCPECRRGFTCLDDPPCSALPSNVPEEPAKVKSIQGEKVNPDYDTSDPEAEWRVSSGNAKRGKRDAALKDQQSTGRKRAAVLFRLDRDADCEWSKASISNPMGGGLYPVVFGCDNTQSHRHHGPEKNTLNNDEDNVSRICAFHHNNWHAKNDPVYNPANPVRHEISDQIRAGILKPTWTGPIKPEELKGIKVED